MFKMFKLFVLLVILQVTASSYFNLNRLFTCLTDEDCLLQGPINGRPNCFEDYSPKKLPCRCEQVCVPDECNNKQCDEDELEDCPTTYCSGGEKEITLPCECCPKCVPSTCEQPEDCNHSKCPKLNCKYWQQPVLKPCECCPVCEPKECRTEHECDFVKCHPLECRPNEILMKLPCKCCQECVPKHRPGNYLFEDNIECGNPNCDEGFVAKKMTEDGCLECVPEGCKGYDDCVDENCPEVNCNEFQMLVHNTCECCPYCKMNWYY